jgi:hypothetical protein
MSVEKHDHPIGCMAVFFIMYCLMTSCEVDDLKRRVRQDERIGNEQVQNFHARLRLLEIRHEGLEK